MKTKNLNLELVHHRKFSMLFYICQINTARTESSNIFRDGN